MSAPLFARNDQSHFAVWYRSVDLPLVALFSALMGGGLFLAYTATPPVAERLGLAYNALALRHLILLPFAFVAMLVVSFMPARLVRRAALVLMPVCLGLLLFTFFQGQEIKGATRWIRVFGFSLQPSEFAKPCFALVAAWLLSASGGELRHPASIATFALFAVLAILFIVQPDIGQLVVLTLVFGAQFFLAGFPLVFVGALALFAALVAVAAYFHFPHVAERLRSFLDPTAGDPFQVERSLAAFREGGWVGVGPGNGTVKETIPDVHADFVFAVVAEEFGLLGAMIVVIVFAIIAVRVLLRCANEQRGFIALASVGLITQFTLQALINIGSSLHLIPTKGMTLPFLSYGGSSLLATSIAMGALLSLLRKPVHAEGKV